MKLPKEDRSPHTFASQGVQVGVFKSGRSDSGDHVAAIRDDEPLVCSCPGWQSHQKCWHMDWMTNGR